MTRFVTLTLSLVALATSAAGAEEDTRTQAAEWASRTGTIAGSATFCEMDEDVVEEYINKAQAKIASTTVDDLDLVAARIEFRNVYAASAARAPVEGCDQFARSFKRKLALLD